VIALKGDCEMMAVIKRIIVPVVGLLFVIGCEVTEEKIELWKGTKNGPKKLAATAIDKDVPVPMRAKAVVALSDIRDREDEDVWDLFVKTFQKMEKADAQKVVDEAITSVAKKVSAGSKGAISKSQVGAKDSLYIMIDYASDKGKVEAEKALISWCTTDYNIRALAGKYNIRAIVKKIGAPAAEALITLLNLDEVAMKFIAELIRDIGDETVLKKASAKLAEDIKGNLKKVKEIHLVTAAIIGQDAVGKMFLELAQNEEITPELQRYALRAFSEGLATESIKASDEHVAALFAVAESSKLDRAQREEAYYVIAQAKRPEDVPKLRKLLRSKDGFWRSVGLHSLLRLDGAGLMEKSLEELDNDKLVKTPDDVDEIMVRILAFPNLLPTVRKLLESKSAFVVGIAIGVLGEAGGAEDLEPLKKLKGSDEGLPKSFRHKTVSEAVKAAIAQLGERGIK
jgi:hypothetical protein